ncbi:hypothetical protein Y1Q_0017493 [Alligator mississippiensis]|uniref:Uncharacterized protein n=1 Tax=Alligator mississippiensis TaxID=8496 RepID=A0A151P2A8_ALLMI|nr:hypothetical protein Y1Q_0017493 [Alligator mississippiensis]
MQQVEEHLIPGMLMKLKHHLEKHLFHGSSAELFKFICYNHLEPDFSGLHKPTYDKGCYFYSLQAIPITLPCQQGRVMLCIPD